jgi:hypothetical protein
MNEICVTGLKSYGGEGKLAFGCAELFVLVGESIILDCRTSPSIKA